MSKYVHGKYVGHILCRQKMSENMSTDLSDILCHNNPV